MASKVKADPAVRAGLNDLVLEVGRIEIEIDQAEALMQKRIDAIRAECAPRIEALAHQHQVASDAATAFASEHRAELMGPKRKSVRVVCGTVSHRQQPPRMDLLSGWTWRRVLEQLLRRLPTFVRTVQEPDREALLAAAKGGDVDASGLGAVGLRLGGGEERWDVKPDHQSVRDEITKRG